MYTTCMFCKKSLGTNEVVESFPVGRTLAFDAAKGRLWVVCGACDRWNLTPIEERWEAVETCERLFLGTRIRTSTENVGLARHPEGLELVRIGKPPRPEFAAWRYGDQFGKRMRRRIVTGTAVGAVLAGGIALGGVALGSAGTLGAAWATVLGRDLRPVVRFRPSDGRLRRLNRICRLTTVVHPADDPTGFGVRTSSGWGLPSMFRWEWFEGDDAHRALDAILPWVNAIGGGRQTVQSAVAEIESERHPSRFLRELPRRMRLPNPGNAESPGEPGFSLGGMRKPTRLALEMALHEEQERRALEGELWLLERAWREAEEIAAIADNLLLPRGIEG